MPDGAAAAALPDHAAGLRCRPARPAGARCSTPSTSPACGWRSPAGSEDEVARAADALRPVCHARDVPLVVADHFRLAGRLGLDGVHLERRRAPGARRPQGARRRRHRRRLRPRLAPRRPDRRPRSAPTTSASARSARPASATARTAPLELFEWWSEMIEVPVVAEGGLTPDLAADPRRGGRLPRPRRRALAAPEGPRAGAPRPSPHASARWPETRCMRVSRRAAPHRRLVAAFAAVRRGL